MNQLFVKAASVAGATLATLLAGAALLAQQNAPAAQQAQRESARRSNAPYSDEQFIRSAAESSMSQVDLGKMAEQKAQNTEVKKFAQLMVEEHSKISEQLKQMGMSEGINLPTSVSRQDAAMHRQLASSSGPAFEKSYARQVMAELEKQTAEFKRGASTAIKPSLKEFAERTLPTLESELQQAKQVMGHAGTTR
jgi:putative membrane protein